MTIPDSLYLKIRVKTTVKEAWDVLKVQFEMHSKMFMINQQKKLQEMQCAEEGDVHTHFTT